jgi:hypothetical protein
MHQVVLSNQMMMIFFDENDNGNDDGNDNDNGNDNDDNDGNDNDNGDDGNDGGNPNLNDGNTSNPNFTQTPINQNYYNMDSSKRLGLRKDVLNDVLNGIFTEKANESIQETHDNQEVDESQDTQQFRDDQMIKIIKWLRNQKMARKIVNKPKNKIWEIFHKLWKNTEEVQELQTLMHLQGQRGNVSSVFKNFQVAKNNNKRKAYIQDDQNLEEDKKEEELVLQKSIQIKIHPYQKNKN